MSRWPLGAGLGGRLGGVTRWFPRPPSLRLSLLRLLHLNVGLMLFGLSVAFMLRAGVGLGPWDVFHQGLELRTRLTIGQAMVLAGLILLLFSAAVAQVRPGVGTVLNMALVGPWVDAFLAWRGLPAPEGWAYGAAMFAFGLVLNGVATGVYITAGLGAGPRDGFALGLARLARVPVRRARTGVELVVLTTGWALGGTVGLGTLAFAVAIGPLMQTSLRLSGRLERGYLRATATAAPKHRPAPERKPGPVDGT